MTWSPPDDGGSAITSYIIQVRQGDYDLDPSTTHAGDYETYYTELSNCDGDNAAIVSQAYC